MQGKVHQLEQIAAALESFNSILMQGKADAGKKVAVVPISFQFHSDARERRFTPLLDNIVILFQFHSDARESSMPA